MAEEEETESKLARVCWMVTTLTVLIVALIMFIKGDRGYGIVCLLVAMSAGINLL